jgi:hypothetical protein
MTIFLKIVLVIWSTSQKFMENMSLNKACMLYLRRSGVDCALGPKMVTQHVCDPPAVVSRITECHSMCSVFVPIVFYCLAQ